METSHFECHSICVLFMDTDVEITDLSCGQWMTGKEWNEGVRTQVLRRHTKGGIYLPRRLCRLIDGWKLVYFCVYGMFHQILKSGQN